MILLKKNSLDSNLYNAVTMDSPGAVTGVGAIYKNCLEGSSALDNFELAYSKISTSFENFGYSIPNAGDFETYVKPVYQSLRHSLAFDWVINYFVGEIKKVFPFSHFKKFKHTDEFILRHKSDPVFAAELEKIKGHFDKLISFVFDNGDSTVLARLSNDVGSEDFGTCLSWLRLNDNFDSYPMSEDSLLKTNYLIALGMMLSDGVGIFKRVGWHEVFEKIETQELKDHILVVGGKYRAFAFGMFGETVGWKKLENGIAYNPFGLPLNSTKTFADEQTMFVLSENDLLIDESFHPLISINSDNFMTPNEFSKLVLPIDKPLKVRVKYKMSGLSGISIPIQAVSNCIIKDSDIDLDENGEGETQLVVKGTNLEFLVGHKKSAIPCAMYINYKPKDANIQWA